MDKIADGYISGILRSGDMEGKAGSALVLHNVPDTLCERILLVGLGKEQELSDKAVLRCGTRRFQGAAWHRRYRRRPVFD